MIPAVEQPYADAFVDFAKTAQGLADALREMAIERFAEMGFPTTHDEEWRFTSLAPVTRTAFELAPPRSVAPAFVDNAGYRLPRRAWFS